jgi:hypothetical protein
MRAAKRNCKGTRPGSAWARTGASLVLMCLFMLGLGMVLPSSASSLDAPFQRNSFGAGRRELLGVQESTASDGRSFLQFQTRRNWAGESVSSQFCSYDDASQSCNWSDYAQSLSLLATPPAVIGLFFFVLYIVSFCCRCCCVMNRCCMLPWTGSSIEPWLMRIGLIVISICIMGMAVMGHVGNAWAHEGIDNLQDDAGNYATKIVNLTNDAADLLVKLDSSQNATAQTAKSDASDVQSNISDFTDILKKVETARFVVFLVTFIVIFGTGVSAFFSICCFRRPTFCSNYWYAVVLLVPIFVIMAGCIVFGAGAADVCTAYDDAQVNATNNIFSKILGSAWGVDCAALQDLMDPLLSEYNSTINSVCSYYDTLCTSYTGVSNCQNCSTTSDLDNLRLTDMTETFYCNDSTKSLCIDQSICTTSPNAICYTQTQTFAECVTQCLSANNRNVTNTTIYYVDLYDELNSTITDITPYVGCGLITQFVEVTDEALCVEFMAGDYLVVVATIALGGLWMFYEVTNLLAFERAGLRRDKD